MNSSILSPAQQVDTAWVRRYNGPGNSDDEARSIAVDDSSNVYVTGNSVGSGTGKDYAVVKYYPNGDTAWVRRYNGPASSNDEAYAIAVDHSGNVYVTGYSIGSGTAEDYLTIKYQPDGDTAWVRRYDGPASSADLAYAIAVDDSANVYVTGYSYGTGTKTDYATIKYYPNGDTAWVRRYDGPVNYYDHAYAIAIDDSNNVYVTGCSNIDGVYHTDFATIKYHPNGDTAWIRTYTGTGNSADYAFAIAVDDSNNVYVTGFYQTISGGPGARDYLTVKYYPNGDTAWGKSYDGAGAEDIPYAVAVDGSGNVYVNGWSTGSGTSHDYATIKYDSNGDSVWVRRYNGSGNSDDDTHNIALDDSGNVYVTGFSEGIGSSRDIVTIKYYSNGDTAWIKRSNGPGNGWDGAWDITLDRIGNIYVTGISADSGQSWDYATIKYWQNSSPNSYLLISPLNADSVKTPVTFDWQRSIDLDPNDTVRYDLYLSRSIVFAPESIIVYDNLLDTTFTDSLDIRLWYWKVKAYDRWGAERWSDQQDWSFYVYLCGDCNGDGKITVSDVICEINYLFKGGSAPIPLIAGDVNCDGKETVSDVVYKINYLFKGGPELCKDCP